MNDNKETLEEDVDTNEGYSIQFIDRDGKVGMIVRGMEKYQKPGVEPPDLTEAFIFAMCVEKMVRTGMIGAAAPHYCAADIAAIASARQKWLDENKPKLVLPTGKEVEHIDKNKNK